jgi:putative glutamine amidotransferase
MAVIGMTDPMTSGWKLVAYRKWVESGIPGTEVAILNSVAHTAKSVVLCDGIILSGGGDVDPARYGRSDAADLVRGVDPQRDAFECAVIEESLRIGIPMLGICRGAQVFNVALGGSLHPDLTAAGYPGHESGEGKVREHPISVENGSLLRRVAGVQNGVVNSYHHQAVERPGRGLRISARSADGVGEALEWEEQNGRPFLLMVQWHPERMNGETALLSGTLLRHFADAIQQYHRTRHTAAHDPTP